MPISRRNISAVTKDFYRDVLRLEKFDSDNQEKFTKTPAQITKTQLHFLTEAIFLRAFRIYEKVVRDHFLLFCMERPSPSKIAKSYLKPKSFLHSEELIKSSLRFLDWTNPEIVIQRAETYLVDGYPIKEPLATRRQVLHEFRKIRNHIAHDSKESLDGYKSVLRQYYGTIPLTIPSPGEFLLEQDINDPSKYKLIKYFDLMREIVNDFQ